MPALESRTAAARRRAGARDVAAERWLLILGLVVAAVVAFGLLGSGPRERPTPDRPLTMAEARRSNAQVSVVRARRGRAAPFRFLGGPAARAQPVECLATAALYEVGNDRRGQRAVIQVVLNRARAPGFPRTVCGVVYQGYARTTGCQFSFTCDGSFRRRAIHLGWARARRAARRALAGEVFAEVGCATHYHADWVVPYWRDTMWKVASVGDHLFYAGRRPLPATATAERHST